jgi:hypothetical protein
MKNNKHVQIILSAIMILTVLLALGPVIPARAAAVLSITPITWNVIGLDSNNVYVGPNHFPIGARVCNTGDTAATNVTATMSWDSSNSYIDFRPGTDNTLTLATLSNVSPDNCTDFYFEVEVARNAAAYDTTRNYHISVSADGLAAISTTTPRELYVEHLISQNRNDTNDIQLSTTGLAGSYTSVGPGGSMTLLVGNTYWIKLIGFTATNGYEQIETFINLPNTIFQVISVSTTYTADTSGNVSNPSDLLYGDGCTWENNPLSPNYRSCLDVGKDGGDITVTYEVKILKVPTSPLTNPESLYSLIYDFSGSSYHYNANFGAAVRYVDVVDPSAVGITKSFNPSTIGLGGVSALTITLTNPTPGTISGYNFTDPLPTHITTTGTAPTTVGCGSPTLVAPIGAGSFSSSPQTSFGFSNGTLAPNSTCSITLNVTTDGTATATTYTNTTNHLYIDSVDTTKYGQANLTVNNAPPPPPLPASCADPVELALWDFSSGTTAATSHAADVTTSQLFYSAYGGTNTVGIAPKSSGTTAWGAIGPHSSGGTSWIETVTESYNYFEFTLNTSNYNGIYVTFDADPDNGGDWANPNSNIFVKSSADGGAFTVYTTSPTPTYPQASKGGWTTGLIATAAASGTSSTVFRFSADSGSKTTAALYLDNISFKGCRRPDPSTVVKNFSPDPVAVGGNSTLTFTITNPNTDAGAVLSGISLSDFLPADNLQGTVAVTNGSPSVTGTGTAFKSQLTAGSIVYIPSTLVDLTGTLAVTQGSQLVTGTGTNFSSQLAAGYIISINSVNYTVSSITDATHLTLVRPYRGSTAGGLTASSNYVTKYTVSSITDDTHLALTGNYSGATASGLTVSAGLTLTAAPTTSCSGSTVSGATGGRAISLAGNSLTGTVAVSSGTATVTGTGTSFTTQLAIGSNVYINSILYKVSAIASATSLTLTSNYGGATASGLTMTTDSTNLTGTVAVTNASATVTGTGTTFTTQLAVGNVVTIVGVSYGVSAIGSNTSLTLNRNYTGTTASGLTMTRMVGLAGGATCTITATVKANAGGVRTNVSGTITSQEGGENTTSTGYAVDTLTAVLPPVISKTFSPNLIASGGTSTLKFTIQNPNLNNAISGVKFTDAFPAGVTVASPLTTTNVCTTGGTTGILYSSAGTVALAAGDSSIRLGSSTDTNTATIAAGGSCTITVAVTASTLTGNLTGTIAVTNGSTAITGTGTLFSTELAVGRTIYINGARYMVANITDNTHLTLTNSFAEATASGITVPSGDFNISGNVAHMIGATTYYGNTASDTLMVRSSSPSLNLMKQVSNSASGPWYNSEIIPAGGNVYYKFTVENTGDVQLTSVGVTDPDVSTSGCSWISPLPAPTSTTADPVTTCIVGPLSAVSGSKINTARANGTSGGTDYYSNYDSASYENGNFGHLPSAYLNMNLFDDGGAMMLNGSTYLGSSVTTTDSDGINTATYTPKSTDNGVTWTGNWDTGTGYATVNVTCPAPDCYLYAWFDWNGDKDFNDANETYSWTITTSGNSNLAISFAYGGTNPLAAGTYYSRFRLYATQPSNPQPYGLALTSGGVPIVGEIEDPPIVSSGGGTPTPVTLSYFLAQKKGNSVNFTWSTATETGNVGFNLYVKSGNSLTRINDELIPSQVIDSLDRQDYTYSAQVKGSIFYIEDVSVLGETRQHGPFQLGKAYGSQLEPDKIDWNAIQAEHNNKYTLRQSGLKQNMDVPAAAFNSNGPMSQGSGEKSGKLEPNHKPTTTDQPTTVFKKTKMPGPKISPTPTPTVVPTFVPTETVEPTNTPEVTLEPTIDPTLTPEPTFEPTATDEPTLEPTDEPTLTPEPTLEPTEEPTATPSEYATPVPVDSSSLLLTTTLNMKVRQTGIYRVTYEMLKNAGLDLAGVPTASIAVLNQGYMMPDYVYTPDTGGNFGTGGYIEFYGEALDTIYTDTNIYTVQVSTASVPQIPVKSAAPDEGMTPVLSYTETLVVNNQKAYSPTGSDTDPWFDTTMRVTSTSNSWNFTVQVNDLADPLAEATLDLCVLGYSSSSINPDHHLLVRFNGTLVKDKYFDDIVEQNLSIDLPAGILHEGANILQLTLPADTGAPMDVLHLDKYTLTYQRLLKAQNGRLRFTAMGDFDIITNLPSANLIVYRMRASGLMQLNDMQIQAEDGTFSATFAGTDQADTYLVTTVEALYTPDLEATRPIVDVNHPAQYLIISHPDFIGGLQPLIQAKQAQGLTVSVVDVTDLYNKYTYGIFDPQAIKSYIAFAAQNLGTKYVLLVGGDTYDYRNYLGRNSISFIPSLYVSTGRAAGFVPTDPLYTDLNSDNIPDLAIGRFPVRSTAELTIMVNKILAYTNKSYNRTAVFATDVNDGSISFKSIGADLAAGLPTGWSSTTINLNDMSVSLAKTNLLAAMNRGTALVTFIGHSGPQTWTFSNLFSTTDAVALTNAGRPFVVVQWGCWNTYFVDPVYSTLVQKFLLSGDKGAATVLGATTLADSNSEELLGDLLTPRLVTPGMTIGQALQDAKFELSKTHPELSDVLLGFSLMGDPALIIQP